MFIDFPRPLTEPILTLTQGEGNFDDASAKASGAGTPVPEPVEAPVTKKKGGRVGTGKSKKAKTAAQRLAIIDAEGDLGMGGGN